MKIQLILNEIVKWSKELTFLSMLGADFSFNFNKKQTI